MDAGEWCLLESDPGVFSALIREFGCSGAQVDEIWSLDAENFEPLGEVFGLIFLFKWDGKKETASKVSFKIIKILFSVDEFRYSSADSMKVLENGLFGHTVVF